MKKLIFSLTLLISTVSIAIPAIGVLTVGGNYKASDISTDTFHAIAFLGTCDYFQTKWPIQHKELIAKQAINVTAFAMDINNVCGIAPDHDSVILLKSAIESDPKCYGSRILSIAHEILHLVGMPYHKYYKSTKDYFAKDPIEQVIRFCAEELINNAKNSGK